MTDVGHDLPALERWLDTLEERVEQPHLADDERRRLRNLRDELASHVLAAQVLVTSGASPATVAPVLERAAALLDDERRRGSLVA